MFYYSEPDITIREPDEKQYIKKSIVVDTEADIPEPEENWATNSYVFLIDTREIKFLNSKGEWI